MKIVILGSPERRKKDLELLKDAKGVFDKALYVSIDSVKLEVSDEMKVSFEKTDLSDFDVILPVPTYEHKETYYMCLKILEKSCYVPYKSDDFFLLWNKPLLIKKLQESDINVRKTVVVASNYIPENAVKELKLPIIVNSYKGKVLVTDKNTLKDVMDLFKKGIMNRLEKPISANKSIWCFIVGDEVIGCYEKVGDERKRMTKASSDITKLSKRIKSIVNTDFCIINFLETKDKIIVKNISVTPDFPLFEKITGKNLGLSLLIYVKSQIEEEKLPFITKFIIDVMDLLKRLVKQ